MARNRPDQPSARRGREVAEASRQNSHTSSTNSSITIPLSIQPPLNSTPSTSRNESQSSIDEQLSTASNNSLEEQLQQFYERQEAFMKRLEERVENRLQKASKRLSKDLTSAVRLAYSLLKDDNGRDLTWNLQKRFSEEENKRVNEMLIASIRNTDSKTPLVKIAAAMKVHFRTKKRQQKLKDSNKNTAVLKDQRRRSRLNSKRSSRASALNQTTKYTEEEKKKLFGYLKNTEYVSSEESMSEDDIADDTDGSEEDDAAPQRKKVLIVKTLPWRSLDLTNAFKYLDKRSKRKKSSRSVSMAIERKTGTPSTRCQPVEEEEV